MPLSFCIGANIIMADPERGGIEIVPEQYTVEYSARDFARVSLSGILVNTFEAGTVDSNPLKRFSLLELMDEVSRRIKSGENKRESMKPIESKAIHRNGAYHKGQVLTQHFGKDGEVI